jgi:hypothetical protein
MIKEPQMTDFIHNHAYFKRKIEPALLPIAKSEPSQRQPGTAPKSGCLDQEEPMGCDVIGVQAR